MLCFAINSTLCATSAAVYSHFSFSNNLQTMESEVVSHNTEMGVVTTPIYLTQKVCCLIYSVFVYVHCISLLINVV